MLSVLLNFVCTGFFPVLGNSAEGSHEKPSLSARSSDDIRWVNYVLLQCHTHNDSHIIKIYKEFVDPIPPLNAMIIKRLFLLGLVTTKNGRIYRCCGFNHQSPNKCSTHNDTQKIIITGNYRKPILLALPTPLVNSGEKVTLKCHSKIMFDNFILTVQKNEIIKDSFKLSAESHLGGSHANFSIGPVTSNHAGTYKCYGSYHQIPYQWSESSDSVSIRITGLYKKPSLSALMDSVAMSGENITLSCISDLQFDMFHLSMDGEPQEHGLPAMQSHNGTVRANFLIDPVTQAGNYRCYGSFRNSSYVWSSPSDHFCLPVPVSSSRNCHSNTEPDSNTNDHGLLHILIRLPVFMMPVFLVFLINCWYSAKKNKYQEEASEYHLRSMTI